MPRLLLPKMGETSVLSEVSLLEIETIRCFCFFFFAAFLTFYFQVDVGHGESQYVSYFEQSSVCPADPVQKYHRTFQSEAVIQTQLRSGLKSKGEKKTKQTLNS